MRDTCYYVSVSSIKYVLLNPYQSYVQKPSVTDEYWPGLEPRVAIE